MKLSDYLAGDISIEVFYMGCKIVEVVPIGTRYALITVRLPAPISGDHHVLVTLDVDIETEEGVEE